MPKAPLPPIQPHRPPHKDAPGKHTPEEIAATLVKHAGVVSLVARELHMARWSVYRYIDKYPICRRAYEDQRQNMLDAAELKLHEAIIRGEAWAIQFALRTVGRDRGYGEKPDDPKAKAPDGNINFTLEIVTPNDPGAADRADRRRRALPAGEATEGEIIDVEYTVGP